MNTTKVIQKKDQKLTVIKHRKAENDLIDNIKRIEESIYNLGRRGVLRLDNAKQELVDFKAVGDDLSRVFENWKLRPKIETKSILELDIDEIQDLMQQVNQIKEIAIKKTEDKTGSKVMRSNKTFELLM